MFAELGTFRGQELVTLLQFAIALLVQLLQKELHCARVADRVALLKVAREEPFLLETG
jgi:hypothetical protein